MGGLATVNNISSKKIDIMNFSDEMYYDFRKSIINLVKALNNAYGKAFGNPIWKDDILIDTFKIFTGSGNSFFWKNKADFTKVKQSIGDLDIQVPDTIRENLKQFLEDNKGKSFNGYKLLGSKIGLDFYNLFEAPKKYSPYATIVQLDIEFNEYDKDGNPNEFDIWAKNSDWKDLEQGIKGVAKQELIPCIYKIKYRKNGILLQPKSDTPAKNQRGGNFNSISMGPKGSRCHYVPVIGKDGKQIYVNGKPAYRETKVKETGTNKDLKKIFYEMFDHQPNEEELNKLWTYIGILELMKENYTEKMIQEIYELYHEHMKDHCGNDQKVYNSFMTTFTKVFPFVYLKSESLNFDKFLKMNLLEG